MNPSILIVEDEPFLALELESLVADVVEATVVVCRRAADALREIEARPFDLALLDIEVVDGTTFELADALAKRGDRFVFVSGSGLEVEAGQHGALDYVSKPYGADHMRRVIRRGLGRAA